MKEELKELSNEELVSVYHLVLEHKEFLENEKKKLAEDENERNVSD